MKKIFILLFAIGVCGNLFSEEKIGSYAMSYFDGRSFEIQASEPKNNKFYLYIQVGGEHKSDKVMLSIESKDLLAFKDALIQIRDKFLEWKKTAIENNVKDITKDFPITFPRVNIAWYGSKWWFAFNQRIKPTFFVFKDGTCAMVVYTKAESSTNEYIDQEVYWVLQEESEFNDIIRFLDENVIIEHFKAKSSQTDLFN